MTELTVGLNLCQKMCIRDRNYSVERQEYAITEILPVQSDFKKEDVLKLLVQLGEEGNYTKHYFPQENLMKVFLKGWPRSNNFC